MANLRDLFSVFPARAGVIPGGDSEKLNEDRLSRASGGDPGKYDVIPFVPESFPRERG